MTRKFTPHFSVNEMTRSRTAKARGIPNNPSAKVMKNLKSLCEALELLRLKTGPLRVTSGFRSAALNKAIGGSARSYHRFGLAVDVKSKTLSVEEVAQFAAQVPLVDSVICERDGKRRCWVHIQLARCGEMPRQKWMTARRVSGKMKYFKCSPHFEGPEVV